MRLCTSGQGCCHCRTSMHTVVYTLPDPGPRGARTTAVEASTRNGMNAAPMMPAVRASDGGWIPMSYIARWVALLDARGVSVQEALAGTSVTVDQLEDPAARVSVADLVWLITTGFRLAGDLSLGLELGLALKPTAHSWFGIAIMTANTVGEATELGARYIATRAAPWRMHVVREGNRAALQFDEIVSLGPARQIVLECLLGGGIRLA